MKKLTISVCLVGLCSSAFCGQDPIVLENKINRTIASTDISKLLDKYSSGDERAYLYELMKKMKLHDLSLVESEKKGNFHFADKKLKGITISDLNPDDSSFHLNGHKVSFSSLEHPIQKYKKIHKILISTMTYDESLVDLIISPVSAAPPESRGTMAVLAFGMIFRDHFCQSGI